MEAFCCDRGKRLFISTDVKLANRLLELMRHSRDMITPHANRECWKSAIAYNEICTMTLRHGCYRCSTKRVNP